MKTLLTLCHGLQERTFEPGELLLAEGETDDLLYVLIEGEVEVFRGDTLVNRQSEPGAIFGELAVLLDRPHTANVRASKATRAFMTEQARSFLRSSPDLSYHLAVILGHKLNSITSYLVDLKQQFADRSDHLGMVDEVLDSLLHEPVSDLQPGSDRCPD